MGELRPLRLPEKEIKVGKCGVAAVVREMPRRQRSLKSSGIAIQGAPRIYFWIVSSYMLFIVNILQ